MTTWSLPAALLVLACAADSLAARAPEPGISDSEIVFGECAALSGPVSDLGLALNAGLRAAFSEVNAAGGIQGRRLSLMAADDGYEPDRTVDCTLKFVESGQVFALAGYVGTPTSKVAAPIAQEFRIPLVGLFTGADLLRTPVQHYVVNVRASYDDETEALVERLVKVEKTTRVAVFYQNDSFGLSGLTGVEKALARRGLVLASKGSFERNTLAIRSGLAHVMAAAPEAVIIVAPYAPAAAFVREARESGLAARFATISFVGTERFISDLGSAAEGVMISQVVPPPSGDAIAIARQYRNALGLVQPAASPSYAGFEGYVTGKLIAAALTGAGPDLTREKFIDALEAMSRFDLAGMIFSFSSADHQGSDAVFLTTVRNGRAAPER